MSATTTKVSHGFQHGWLRCAAQISLIVSLVIGAAPQILAQANPVSPPTREELNPAQGSDLERSGRPTPIEGGIERSSCPLAAPQYAEITTAISEVRFNNLQEVTADDLVSSYEEFLGTTQPIAVICEIRDRAATILRKEGYLAAVQVPTQRIENGVIQLEILFARITAIRVRGEVGRAEKLVAKYLEKLTENPVYNRNTAERYLLLARDLPGYDIRMTLVPAGTAPGDLIGEVIVVRTPYEVDFNIQNLAASDTGRWGGQLRGQLFGLTGMGDRTTMSFYSTSDFEEQQVLQLGHEFRVGSEGLKLAGNFTYAWTRPQIAGLGAGTNVTANTLVASVEGSYPLVRRQAASIYASMGFDFVNQDVDFIGPLSRDRLRVGYARIDARAIDFKPRAPPKWRAAGSIEFRQGLSLLGASDRCDLICLFTQTPPSRVDGDPTSSLLRFRAEAEVELSPAISAYLNLSGQWAFDPLFSYEEFAGGNYTIGRGYDPGTIVGDDGVGASFELRSARLTPFKDKDITIQPFVFVDSAWAWDDSRNGTNDPQRLTSIGGGIKARLSNRYRLDMTLAAPTNAAGFQTSTGNVRFLVSLTTRLLPWRR